VACAIAVVGGVPASRLRRVASRLRAHSTGVESTSTRLSWKPGCRWRTLRSATRCKPSVSRWWQG
jgi:hypothetical protein